jgi:hypothetical protein
VDARHKAGHDEDTNSGGTGTMGISLIGVLASVLLHVSSPVKMLESVANVVRDEIVIVERFIPEIADQPVCRLVPSAENAVVNAWWEFSPRFFEQYLEVLGFPNTWITHHRQRYMTTNEDWDFFTIVGAR